MLRLLKKYLKLQETRPYLHLLRRQTHEFTRTRVTADYGRSPFQHLVDG